MTTKETSRRLPWVTLALSFLASGVGHIYCGRIVKGLFLYSARFLLPLLCIIAAFVQPSNGVFLGLILVPVAATVVLFLYAAVDSYAVVKRTSSDYELKDYNRTSLYWLLVVLQLAYPIVLTLGVKEYVYEPFLIPTRSMSPNYLARDRILVNKRPFRDSFPERGEVVAFRTPSSEPGRTWFDRVIGVAGDQIVIKGREIEVNGKTLERERAPAEASDRIRNQVEGDVYYESCGGRRYQVVFEKEPTSAANADVADTQQIEVTVPARSIFVLGDNRDRSRDSRHIGAIHVGDVIGYADYNYFPAETWSRLGRCGG